MQPTGNDPGPAPDFDAARPAAPSDAPGADAPADPLAAALAERDAFQERWLRAQADFENFRRRARQEAEEARRYQDQRLAADLLPGLDNLARAVAAAESAGSSDELVAGVMMVLRQFEDVLAQHDVVPIACVGQPFDPHRHAALQQIPSADHPPLTVLQEVERGWMLHDRVLRPSRVLVSSAPPETPVS